MEGGGAKGGGAGATSTLVVEVVEVVEVAEVVAVSVAVVLVRALAACCAFQSANVTILTSSSGDGDRRARSGTRVTCRWSEMKGVGGKNSRGRSSGGPNDMTE